MASFFYRYQQTKLLLRNYTCYLPKLVFNSTSNIDFFKLPAWSYHDISKVYRYYSTPHPTKMCYSNLHTKNLLPKAKPKTKIKNTYIYIWNINSQENNTKEWSVFTWQAYQKNWIKFAKSLMTIRTPRILYVLYASCLQCIYNSENDCAGQSFRFFSQEESTVNTQL